MSDGAKMESVQKVARFWETLYGQRPDNGSAGGKRERPASAEPSGDADGITAYDDWILGPDSVVASLPDPVKQALGGPPSLGPVRVLELGCGTSQLALAVCRAYPRAHVLALDVAPAAIEEAEAKRVAFMEAAEMPPEEQDALKRVAFAVADVTSLPATLCPDSSFAVAFDKGTSDTLRFRAKKCERERLAAAMFAEAHRCLSHADLARSGWVCVITPRKRVPDLYGDAAAKAWRSAPAVVAEGAAGGGGGVTVGRARQRIFLHAAQAVRPEHPAPAAQPALALTTDVDPPCPRCGMARLPRYKRQAAWEKHLAFCGQPSTAPPPAATRSDD